MAHKRFTQKEAANLIRDPRSIMEGASVYLDHGYGKDETIITVHDDRGPSFTVRISRGSAGISATIQHCVGSGPLSVSGNDYASWAALPRLEAYEVGATIYALDDYSQDFKRWRHDDGHAIYPFPERDDYDARGNRLTQA